MDIKLESCNYCNERWFDLDVKEGRCHKCAARSKPTKFQATNEMDPGEMPDLPQLTQMEEILISPVHALVSLYQVRG
ncbi:hypothetical protein GGX14DRAFT_344298, partial [Mycena pura]